MLSLSDENDRICNGLFIGEVEEQVIFAIVKTGEELAQEILNGS